MLLILCHPALGALKAQTSSINKQERERERERENRTVKHTGQQAKKQINRHRQITEIQKGRQADRRADRQTDT